MGLKADRFALNRPKPYPRGWRDVRQLAAADRLSTKMAHHYLRIVLKAGSWEKRRWQTMMKDGRLHNINLFRRKPGKSKPPRRPRR